MASTVQCSKHGEATESFVCVHLSGDSVGLGFDQGEPTTSENPFADAWCNDCEIIRAAHNGWNEETEKLTKIVLLCSGCYKRSRIRNTRTPSTLDDLAPLRWKCATCDEWHHGPCLDFSYQTPFYWDERYKSSTEPNTFLNEDLCAIEDKDFFVRGLIEIPILGTAKSFCWGVWGSLSRENFETTRRTMYDPTRVQLAPMFSWLSTSLAEYPETLSLKMYAHVREVGLCPSFEVQETDHPLSQEFHNGITPARVKELMAGALRDFKG